MRLLAGVLGIIAIAALAWVVSLPDKAECVASGRVVDPTERHCEEAGSGYQQLQEHALFHTSQVIVGVLILLAGGYAVHRYLRRRPSAALLAVVLLAAACTPRAAPVTPAGSAQPPLAAIAAAHYDAYGAALAIPRREAIAGFYHPDGALVVFNGVARWRTRAELDARYRGGWSPPAFFAWDGLTFDSIGPGQVLVTGGFRSQRAGQRDTTPYIYAALLSAVDSGLAIVFEHETLRPRP